MEDNLKNAPQAPAILMPPQKQAENKNPVPEVTTVNDELMFFNVMPKNKNQGVLTEPTLEIQELKNGVAPGGNKAINFFKKYKIYIISGAVVIIGGPLIYFIAASISSNSYKADDILLKKPPQLPSPASTNIATTTTPTVPIGSSGGQFSTSKDWRDKFFPGCQDVTLCGDSADPDHDGLTNLEEFKLGTDPNNKDSDNDGLADGDEVHIFGSNPLNAHTAGDPKYNDADNLKGGFDVLVKGKKMTVDQILEISKKMQTFGLHEPTLTTLKQVLNTIYNFSDPNNKAVLTPAPDLNKASSTAPSSSDISAQAKQDRDAQRSNAIKNIGIALIAYQNKNQAFPVVQNFSDLSGFIKLYLKVATNFTDPLNSAPYVYSYSVTGDQKDFILSFYSETQNQLIKKHAADAIKDAQNDTADINDNQRKDDLDSIRTALLLYSNSNISGTQDYVFPTTEKYKTALVPNFISSIPKDPKTGQDYDYQVSTAFNTFTVKTVLDNPPPGTTGYRCNQIDCGSY